MRFVPVYKPEAQLAEVVTNTGERLQTLTATRHSAYEVQQGRLAHVPIIVEFSPKGNRLPDRRPISLFILVKVTKISLRSPF